MSKDTIKTHVMYIRKDINRLERSIESDRKERNEHFDSIYTYIREIQETKIPAMDKRLAGIELKTNYLFALASVILTSILGWIFGAKEKFVDLFTYIFL